MKTLDKKTTKALRSLIIINNDRFEGYQEAEKLVKDSDLKTLFSQLSMQSKGFKNELELHLADMEDAPAVEDKTKASGKLFRGWMEIKDNLAGNNRKAVLSSCEFGEDAAKKAYEDVLDDAEDISNQILDLVHSQKNELKKAHDHIKMLRDNA
jgi:uncharacterized protein (TIGR02284 family)